MKTRRVTDVSVSVVGSLLLPRNSIGFNKWCSWPSPTICPLDWCPSSRKLNGGGGGKCVCIWFSKTKWAPQMDIRCAGSLASLSDCVMSPCSSSASCWSYGGGGDPKKPQQQAGPGSPCQHFDCRAKQSKNWFDLVRLTVQLDFFCLQLKRWLGCWWWFGNPI